MRLINQLLLGAVLALTSAGAMASQWALPRGATQTLYGQDVSVSVVGEYQGYHPIYTQYRKNYIAGEEGERYSLVLQNHSNRRVLAVVSVDGVNVVTGQTASYNQGGYVLEPGQRTVIEGWRKSLRDVARFYFTYPENSYASRTGRDRNLGIIGVAVFRELPYIKIDDEVVFSQHGGAKPSAAAPSARNAQTMEADLGTGHGERVQSHARRTHFEKASHRPNEVLTIRYNTLDALIEAGVVQRERPRRGRYDREAFPGGFVPDPN